jgi:hypothetical protein
MVDRTRCCAARPIKSGKSPRAEIPVHVDEVRSFFKNEKNASPTAVVVGFDGTRSRDRVRILTLEGRPFDGATIAPDGPVPGILEISWIEDKDPRDAQALTQAILERYETLRQFIFDELANLTGIASQTAAALLASIRERAVRGDLALASLLDELSESEDSSESENGTDKDQPEDVVIPDELRSALAGLSPSDVQVVLGRLYLLSQLQEPLLLSQSTEALQDIYHEVCNELKPGLLIDGQHRVMGTKKLGTIPFLVTALPTSQWPELAFQFIVTNRTARKVPRESSDQHRRQFALPSTASRYRRAASPGQHQSRTH